MSRFVLLLALSSRLLHPSVDTYSSFFSYSYSKFTPLQGKPSTDRLEDEVTFLKSSLKTLTKRVNTNEDRQRELNRRFYHVPPKTADESDDQLLEILREIFLNGFRLDPEDTQKVLDDINVVHRIDAGKGIIAKFKSYKTVNKMLNPKRTNLKNYKYPSCQHEISFQVDYCRATYELQGRTRKAFQQAKIANPNKNVKYIQPGKYKIDNKTYEVK